ncbi:MAG: type II secretion system protein [Burkholderiaceae bacterium]|jgi:prepilin-type N-terminal cleavage/methylation domain-containing protein
MKKQAGFTLVEMATVLVIIGLILGMAFKGKDLIDGAKVKSLGAQVGKIEASLQTYFERYGVYPGDGCPAGSGGTALCAGAGTRDGIIAAGTESDVAWLQLTTATNILGQGERQSIFGQNWNFWQGSHAGAVRVGTWLDLPGGAQADSRYFCAYDQKFDDGQPTVGSAVTDGFGSAPNSAYPNNGDCWATTNFVNGIIKVL